MFYTRCYVALIIMKEVDAKIKIEATFQKHIVHDDIEWIKNNGCTVETVYRKTKIGEKVKCLIYPTQNYFLGMAYYDTITEDGYSCCISINDIELLNAT